MVSIHPRRKNEKERKVSEHGRSEKPCPKVSVKTSRQPFREDMTDSIKEGKEEKEHKAIECRCNRIERKRKTESFKESQCNHCGFEEDHEDRREESVKRIDKYCP